MPIAIQHGPSMVDYGLAVAKASEQEAAQSRTSDYANFLSGLQSQQQQYQLGLGGLQTQLGRLGLESAATSQEAAKIRQQEFRNRLEEEELRFKIKLAQDQNYLSFLQSMRSR